MPANATAGPSRLRSQHQQQHAYDGAPGVSFKDTVDTLTSFLEIVIHTILCIRAVYPPTSFTRRRAHGVAVYQSRHPEVRGYVARVCSALGKMLEKGELRRVTIVIKGVRDGLPLERFVVDVGYMSMVGMEGQAGREAKIINAPSPDQLSLMLRAFLIRLTALDGQLTDLHGEETTFAVVVENTDDAEPSAPAADGESPWVPALQSDTLNATVVDGHHEPLLAVRAVETGVIDLRLVVQECSTKTSLSHLNP